MLVTDICVTIRLLLGPAPPLSTLELDTLCLMREQMGLNETYFISN